MYVFHVGADISRCVQDCDFFPPSKISTIQMFLGQRGYIERNFDGRPFFTFLTIRTYFVSFCFLVQLQMLFDIPTPLSLSEINLTLPSSEEEWSAETSEEWQQLHDNAPSTPCFRDAFESLFSGTVEYTHRYSEFGGYVTISGILAAILNSYRLAVTPAIATNWKMFDNALDAWQRSWNADPKSHSTGPSSPFGAIAFNASAIYRATSIRRVKDYSKFPPSCLQLIRRIKATVQFCDERVSSNEIMEHINDESFRRAPQFIRALVPACVSLQIPVKMGMKLVAQTAALFWSVDHVFCNFEVGMSSI
jgi:Fungal specific transcription factor domain